MVVNNKQCGVNGTGLPFCLGRRHPGQAPRSRPQMSLSSSTWCYRWQDFFYSSTQL